MEFVVTIQRTLLPLFLLLTLIYARSVDLPHIKEAVDPKLFDTPFTSDLWIPESGPRDEWYRCHGMPCDQYDRMKHKLKMLKVIEKDEAESPLASLSNLQKNMENYDIDDTDSLDGCIWLTEDQLDGMLLDKGVTNDMLGKNHVIHKRTLDRQVANGGFKKWPNAMVHYKFDGSHSTSEMDTVMGAIRHIEAQTCVRFKQLSTHERFHDHHVLITRQPTGCHSFVGRTSWKPQQLNLQAACIYNFGVPVHEFLHMLGMWHEMQRSDRDSHINVLYSNIGRYASQFGKLDTDNQVEYDLSSVLHYSAKDGASSYRSNSMEAKNPFYQRNMGQRVELSFNDARSINQAYCSDKCTGRPLAKSCERGGYQDPNDCSRCKCPPGFSGQYCQNLAHSKSNCGGEIVLTSSNPRTTIESPNYIRPNFQYGGYYDNHDECNWQIKGENGQKVALEFIDDFGIYCSYNYQCFHWVEVQYELHKNTQGPRFCCRDRPDAIIESEGDEMTVLFRANYTVGHHNSRRGFRAVVSLVGGTNGAERTTTSSTTSTTTTPRTTTTQRPTTTTTPRRTTTTTTTQRPTTTAQRTGSRNRECHKVDLSIALDSSGSVGSTNWIKLREFTKELISRFELSPQCAQVSLISIGTQGYVHSYLDEHSSNINSIVDNMQFRDEWTNTASAFRAMISDIYVPHRGDRSDATNVALLLTDGPSNKDQHLTIPNAREARDQKGVQFLTIGIGNQISRSELFAITGFDAGRNQYVSDFEQILKSDFQRHIFYMITDIVSGNVNNRPTAQPTTTSSTTTTTTTQRPNTGSGSNFECSFENGNQATWCGITQEPFDDFDWTITNRPSPSDETGPSYANSGNYYIFIEASSPRRSGDTAAIQLPSVTSSGQYCLSFAYHMHGHHINNLRVNKVSSSNVEELWRKSSNQGNSWKSASVSVTLNAGQRIEFVGVRGNAFSGDIGLDTIRLRSGSC